MQVGSGSCRVGLICFLIQWCEQPLNQISVSSASVFASSLSQGFTLILVVDVFSLVSVMQVNTLCMTHKVEMAADVRVSM